MKVNRRYWLILLVLLVFSITSSNAGEVKKPENPDFTGSWACENKEKEPPPAGETRLLSFSVTLKQNGDKISGKYDYVTYNATRIREGKIKGTMKEGAASVQFFNPEYEWEKGTAILKLKKGNLEWNMIKQPSGEHYIPLKALLKKSK